MASQTILIGAAGEYYVLYELLRREYIAALAPTGAPNVDIIVADIGTIEKIDAALKAAEKEALSGKKRRASA